jgi:hypothetical protein
MVRWGYMISVKEEPSAMNQADKDSLAKRVGPRPNFLDHQDGVINGRQSYNRPGYAGGEPLRSSRRSGEINPMLLLKGAAARVENA